ncbi:MAG: aminopeptidase P family protein, partial [Arenibacterium sp.]
MSLDSAFKDDRKLTYLNAEGADKPLKSPVNDDVLNRARAYRLSRLRLALERADCAALLLYDPCNIRYAFDCSNMQVWTLHNPMRYALILAGGPAIMFEFKGCLHLSEGLPGIDEIRVAKTRMFMASGDKVGLATDNWAGEIADLVQQYGGGNTRIACDYLDGNGVHTLEALGLSYVEGTQLT